MIIPQQVLVFSGHDPTGGAGIQADIETLFHFQAHAIPIITCLTAQDSHNVHRLMPLSAQQIEQQVTPILADLHPKVIKLGLLGDIDVLKAVIKVIRQLPHLPLVVDPILAAGGGKNLSKNLLIQHMIDNLLPLTDILTPNSEEARRLTGATELNQAALLLLKKGCKAVLITGTHENSYQVINTLYQLDPQTKQLTNHALSWPRLNHSYHGSGCTLSSAIAAGLANGKDVITAINQAQHYTWHSLNAGYPAGQGQLFPQRHAPILK